ncbi:phage tail tape measure protein, partial [bacterium]|nr:phage tail tape measure protein [bacterium]
MATKIGDFFAELQLRNKKFLEKLKTSQIGLDRTAKVGKVALGALAVAAAAATTAMVMLAKKSITMAVDFDESMRKVNTLAQLGQEGFEGMKEEVLDLSKTLGKSATEMSDALYQVISATFEGAEAMEVLKTGVMMATAGMAGQVETVDALTTVLNAWGLSAKDAERVADTFFLTIKYGKTTMAELAPAIGVVATMAANAGLSFEEVGAALSALTIVGVDTNRAVTGLSAILTALTKPTDEAKEAAAELGIDFSLTGLKAQGLSKWLGELKDATKGESEQLARFFQNVRAVRAVLPLATNAAEAFNSNLIKMQTETGAAREAFEEMDLAYSRIIERLKVQFEAIYIAVGEDLVPELLKFSKILSDPDFLESIKTVALGIVNFATGVMKLVRGISELVNAYILLKDQEKGVMEPTLLRFVKSQIETYKRLIEEEKEHGGIVGANSIRIMEYTELLGWFELKLEQLTSDQRAINDALIEQERIIKELEEGTEELTDTTEEFGDAIKYGVNRMGEFHRKANQVKDDIEDVTKSTDIWGDVGRQVIGDLTSEIISLTRAVDENVSGWDRFWNIVESGMETLMS